MNNKTFNNIGVVAMLMFVIIIDCVIFNAMSTIMDFKIWFMVMLVPATMTAVVLYMVVSYYGDTLVIHRIKHWLGSIF